MSIYTTECIPSMGGKTCSTQGLYSKDPAVTALQDLLIYGLIGLSVFAHRSREMGYKDLEVDKKIPKFLYYSSKNINFSIESLKNTIHELSEYKNRAENLYKQACRANRVCPEDLIGPAKWQPTETLPELIAQGHKVCVLKNVEFPDPDITGFQDIIKFSMAAIANYLQQIQKHEKIEDRIISKIYFLLNFICEKDKNIDDYVEAALKCGELNFDVMETLNKIHIKYYGPPEPTQVRITPVQGKAILVTGNDYKTLEKVLLNTHGKKINIYTYGEMISAHAFPEIKKHKHLIGNYGGFIKNIRQDFENFPGAILIASNFRQGSGEIYRGRIYSTEDVSWPGIFSIDEDDLRSLINAAYDSQGFLEEIEERYVTIGFGEKSIEIYSTKIYEHYKQEKVKHFVMIGGCDSPSGHCNYFDEVAQRLPNDSILLTLACEKYMYTRDKFGEIEGLSRLIDLGQYNDAFPAIKMALSLAEKFELDINELPLSIIISWNEQKAIATLLTLVYLGIRNIRLGPILPMYVSPRLLDLLLSKFQIIKISTPQKDIEEIIKKVA